MEKYRIKLTTDGRAIRVGYDEPPCEILARNDDCIVLKWKGGMKWSGIGSRSYYPSMVFVYRICGGHPWAKDADQLVGELLIDWELTRKKEKR